MSLFNTIVVDGISAENISTHYAKRAAKRREFAKSPIGKATTAAVENCWLLLNPQEKKISKE